MSKNKLDSTRKKAEKLGLSNIRRHIILCCDRKEADCASAKQMSESWKYLGKRFKELKLTKNHGLYRSQSLCLDVCKGGPIAVVYPEGTWYGNCTTHVLEQILQEHLLRGRVVEQYVVAHSQCAPLPSEEG